jgi:hypothetical protein
LTSAPTFFGAEQFAWDLKLRKRAMVLGERPAAAHMRAYLSGSIRGFEIDIPEAKPANSVFRPGVERNRS